MSLRHHSSIGTQDAVGARTREDWRSEGEIAGLWMSGRRTVVSSSVSSARVGQRMLCYVHAPPHALSCLRLLGPPTRLAVEDALHGHRCEVPTRALAPLRDAIRALAEKCLLLARAHRKLRVADVH
jgi:hypothetical protein